MPCGAIGVFMSQQASGMLRSVDLCQVQAEQPGVAEHAAQHATLLFCRLCPTAVSAFAIPRCMISNPSHAILVAQAISSASTKARTVGRTSALLCKIAIAASSRHRETLVSSTWWTYRTFPTGEWPPPKLRVDILPLNNVSAFEPLRSFRGESDPVSRVSKRTQRFRCRKVIQRQVVTFLAAWSGPYQKIMTDGEVASDEQLAQLRESEFGSRAPTSQFRTVERV